MSCKIHSANSVGPVYIFWLSPVPEFLGLDFEKARRKGEEKECVVRQTTPDHLESA